jgi:hypothetical protein
MANIADIRKQYPQYSDLSDLEIAKGFHSKFYSDIPFDQFSKQIGLSQAQPSFFDRFRGTPSWMQSKPEEAVAPQAAGGDVTNPMAYLSEAQKTEQGPAMQAVSQGVNTAVRTGAGIAKGAVINPAAAVAQVVGGESGRKFAEQAQSSYEQQRKAAGGEGFDVAEIVGAVASPVNRILPGGVVTQSVIGGMLNPVTGQNLDAFDVLKGKAEQAVIGGIFGKTFEAALPAFKQGAQKLINAGADLEPGQAFGGAAGSIMRTAEGLRDTISKVLGREVTPDKVNKAFTYVAVNEALAPVGKLVSKANDDGFALVNQGIKLARQSYDEAFNKIGTVAADGDFRTAVNRIRTEARNLLDPKDFAKLDKEITNNVLRRFNPQTLEIGQGLHNIKKFLNARLDNLSGATDELGMSRKNIYDDLMNQFKDYTYRIDPSGAIKAADTAYANIYRVAAASKKAATSSGNFSPEQLATSAASQSTTLTGGAGTAPLQQFAKEALKIVGKDKTGSLTPSDLKNLGVASGLGYTGLYNPVVLGVAGLFGLTAEALGKLALKNPDVYNKFRTEALKNSGLLSRGITTPTQGEQQGQQ